MNNNNTYKNLKKININDWDIYHGYSENVEKFFTPDSNRDYLIEISDRLRQDIIYVARQLNLLYSDLAVRLGVKLTFEEWMESNFTKDEREACCYSDKLDEYHINNEGIKLPVKYAKIGFLIANLDAMYDNWFHFRKALTTAILDENES